jgi:acetoin utilization deacetylase AcuC-like enzyme
VFTLEKEVEAAKEKVKQEEENLKATQKSIEQTDEAYIDLKEIAKESDQELKMATQKLNATINDDEYLEDVKKIGKDWQAKKEAGKRRMIEFADRVEKGSPVSTMVGGLAGGALGAIFGAAGGPMRRVVM